jgi:SAM-dependent methyltransferase
MYVDSTQFGGSFHPADQNAASITDGYARRLRHLGLLSRKTKFVMEIGAGPAWICRAAKNVSMDVLTRAQDISAECALACPWVDIYHVGQLSEIAADGTVELLSMTHVIEHVTDPASLLRQAAPFLARHGKLYITAPFRPALWKHGDGFKPWLGYSYLHVPAHISYLSSRWMRNAAKAAGLQLVHWDTSLDAFQVFEAILSL